LDRAKQAAHCLFTSLPSPPPPPPPPPPLKTGSVGYSGGKYRYYLVFKNAQ